MPIYAYRCESCGYAKDVLQKISDPLLTVCPSCGAETFRKQLTAAGFQLKGSGWYVTDFRDGGKGKADAAGDKAGGSGDKADKGDKSGGTGGTASAGDTAANAPAPSTAAPAPAAESKPKAAAPAPSSGGSGSSSGSGSST